MEKTITTVYELKDILPSGVFSAKDSCIKAALIADLHDRDCTQTLDILKTEKPDLIFLAGDLMERNKIGAIQADGTRSPWTYENMEEWMATPKNRLWLIRLIKKLDGSISGKDSKKSEAKKWDKQNGYRFLREASRIAPIYYSIGNHEWYHTAEDLQVLQECGVTVLDNRDTVIDPAFLKNDPASLKNGPAFLKNEPAETAGKMQSRTEQRSAGSQSLRTETARKMQSRTEQRSAGSQSLSTETASGQSAGIRIGGLSTRYDKKWLEEFSKKDGMKILLMHHPDHYDRMVRELDTFDLILCGHVHGGQWRFFGRGIFAPGQGFLPKLHHGLYPTEHSKSTGHGGMIISAGCSNTTRIPRWGNPCEVVILRLMAGDAED